MKAHKKMKMLCRISIMIILQLVLACTVSAAEDNLERNKVLLDSLSPFEDIAEAVINKDSRNIESFVVAANKSFKGIKNLITSESSKKIILLLSGINESAKTRKFDILSSQALEAYKVIALELNSKNLTVPIEVVMLDYTGFKIQSLLTMSNIDWVLLGKVAGEANAYWSGIEHNITNKALRDTFNTDIQGLAEAVKKKNREMLFFASQVDLDLVDLLEEYFG